MLVGRAGLTNLHFVLGGIYIGSVGLYSSLFYSSLLGGVGLIWPVELSGIRHNLSGILFSEQTVSWGWLEVKWSQSHTSSENWEAECWTRGKQWSIICILIGIIIWIQMHLSILTEPFRIACQIHCSRGQKDKCFSPHWEGLLLLAINGRRPTESFSICNAVSRQISVTLKTHISAIAH